MAHQGYRAYAGPGSMIDMRPLWTRHAAVAEPTVGIGPGTESADVAPLRPALAGGIIPGLVLSLVVALLCMAVNQFASIASPLLLAIIAGAVVANVREMSVILRPGLAFSGKRLLRAGIVMLGLQLSLQDIAGLGAGMIVVVVVLVALGITATMLIGSWLGVSWNQRVLIACGFSICGAAAVAAADGVVEADEEEVATSIALVVLFGTLMIPLIPMLSSLLGLDSRTAGLWAGTSIHEVAQVVAAAGAIGGGALAVAVVAKLARVLMLAPVMAVLGVYRRYEIGRRGGDARVMMPPIVPLFVAGFAVTVLIGSLLTIPTDVGTALRYVQTALLSAAMFALGCGVRGSALRSVGSRPFVLALLSTLAIAAISLGGVLLVG
jgi:uncharacterized integral membrane protein (TIGR00698 family)